MFYWIPQHTHYVQKVLENPNSKVNNILKKAVANERQIAIKLVLIVAFVCFCSFFLGNGILF